MIEAIEITKIYNKRIIIDKFNAKIAKGDFVAVTGESGKGKTTLLNILGLLERADKGNIVIDGITNPNQKQTMLMQREILGYLFQNYALIENETVEANLKIALGYKKCIDKKEVIAQALEFVNLDGFANRKIYELSGGEQQRVALSRVLIKEASYIFADEPTGNLDKKNRDIVYELLKKLNNIGKTIIYATHDIDLANKAQRIIEI